MKSKLTLEGFLRRFKREAGRVKWVIRSNSRLRAVKPPSMCPITFLAGQRGAFCVGPSVLGLSERDTALIIAAADNESWRVREAMQSLIPRIRARLLKAAGVNI